MRENTRPSIMQNFWYGTCGFDSKAEGYRLWMDCGFFWDHKPIRCFLIMSWDFGILARWPFFDMWENEKVTGEPRNSQYIRGE